MTTFKRSRLRAEIKMARRMTTMFPSRREARPSWRLMQIFHPEPRNRLHPPQYDLILCRQRHLALSSLSLRPQNGPQMKLLRKPIFQTSLSDFKRKNGFTGQIRLVSDPNPEVPLDK